MNPQSANQLDSTVIAALIGAFATIISALIGIIANRATRKKLKNLSNDNAYITFLKAEQNFNHLLGSVSKVLMYTVNSYELLSRINFALEQNKTLKIKKLIIMVRKKPNEVQEDLDILSNIINQWKKWNAKKRIKSLTIISYDHDPDHYYTIIGERVVFAGQVLFDDTKPTGTKVDYLPLVFNDESEAGKQVIKNYKNHFENIVLRYKEKHTLFSSDL